MASERRTVRRLRHAELADFFHQFMTFCEGDGRTLHGELAELITFADRLLDEGGTRPGPGPRRKEEA